MTQLRDLKAGELYTFMQVRKARKDCTFYIVDDDKAYKAGWGIVSQSRILNFDTITKTLVFPCLVHLIDVSLTEDLRVLEIRFNHHSDVFQLNAKIHMPSEVNRRNSGARNLTDVKQYGYIIPWLMQTA